MKRKLDATCAAEESQVVTADIAKEMGWREVAAVLLVLAKMN